MNNPEIIVKNAPFKHFCMSIGAIPTSYKDSLDYYENLLWLIKYLEETIIPTVNNNGEAVSELQTLYIELKNYVDNYFTNLDVQEEINNKLDEMVESGDFDIILDRYSIGKNTFRTKLYFEKLGRFNLTEYIKNGYVGMQGGEKIDDNYFIFALIKDNDSGDARIFKVNLNTGSIVGYNDISGVYHANGCCKKDNSVFFTQTFDNNATELYGIVEVSTNTLSVVDTYTVDFGNASSFQINAIGYDETNDKFILIGRHKFAIANTDFEVESVIDFNVSNDNYKFSQGGGYYNGYVCIVTTNENSILCFNIDGTLHHVIEIGWKQESNQFGELEDVTILSNGDIYINSNLKHSSRNNFYLVQFFKSNIHGGALSDFYSNGSLVDNATIRTVVVNKTAYNNLTDAEKFKCNGTNEKPFESLAEAVSYMDNVNTYEIDVKDTSEYLENLTLVNKNLIIKGNGCKIGTIKTVATKLAVSNLYIEKAGQRTPVFGTHDDYITPLYISTNSELTIEGTFAYNFEACSENMVYPCIIEGSTVYDNSNSSTSTYKKFIEVNSTYYPLITHSKIITKQANSIKTDNLAFVDYLPTNTLVTGEQTFDLTTIPQYTNASRGLIISITTTLGNSHEIRLSQLHANENVVIEDVKNGTTVRQGFRVNFRPGNSEIIITPYSYDHENNVWVADNTIGYRLIYTFNI